MSSYLDSTVMQTKGLGRRAVVYADVRSGLIFIKEDSTIKDCGFWNDTFEGTYCWEGIPRTNPPAALYSKQNRGLQEFQEDEKKALEDSKVSTSKGKPKPKRGRGRPVGSKNKVPKAAKKPSKKAKAAQAMPPPKAKPKKKKKKKTKKREAVVLSDPDARGAGGTVVIWETPSGLKRKTRQANALLERLCLKDGRYAYDEWLNCPYFHVDLINFLRKKSF